MSEQMCEAMRQIIAEEREKAVLELFIQLFIEGDVSVERTAEKTGMTVEEFLKKKEEYENRQEKQITPHKKEKKI